ncbi:hypothetical protein B0T24DRAFT_39255 [Lasiosphaeria ovina]|uniref:RNA polymerase II transcription factor SIII subunit A n=1 Tax=Lasiosphaeria ovina TaxID=92902 RepID=A0AAE0TXJ7_9PEZI|nr:hypothetical protein B0T24DRAFT_39255 [Lasiosphaeria ovina]
MAPRSLYAMGLRVALDNINLITGLGSMPPKAVTAILRAIKTASQLHAIELNSDDIYEETAEHWRRIIKQDFPFLSAEHKWIPSNPKSWHKIYEKYQTLQAQIDAAATEKLKNTYAAQQKAKEASKTHLIKNAAEARHLPPVPQDGKRQSTATTPHWSTQARPKQSFVQKARREAHDQAMRLKLSTPTGKLPVMPGQIKRAPESMITSKRIENQFDPTASIVRAPRTITRASASDPDREEREARLLRIKNAGKAKTAAASTSGAQVLSFDDDDDNIVDYTPTTSKGRFLDDLELDEVAIKPEYESDSPPTPEMRPLKRAPDGYRALSPPAKKHKIEEPSSPYSQNTKVYSASSPPETASPTSQRAPLKRRRGLLSSAPGSNSVTPVVRAPILVPIAARGASPPPPDPVATGPSTSPSALNDLNPFETVASSKPPARQPADSVVAGKKKRVDIFMKPKKRRRT